MARRQLWLGEMVLRSFVASLDRSIDSFLDPNAGWLERKSFAVSGESIGCRGSDLWAKSALGHSHLKAAIGSTRDARRAGRNAATKATTASSEITANRVTGSKAEIPYNMP